MSTQDMRKLTSVLKSIELIEEKTNILHSQLSTILDDTNVDLQMFFQHFEQLLQIDLKNRKSLLNNNTNNNKQNYWSFFSAALKDSKSSYDTILYVINSQDVKTPMGRGRLFIRFCLQTHRLGDVIQQSFMMKKIVYQYYNDECFWANPMYLNRIIQAIYQLNDSEFNLLSNTHYQLDISWPMIESIENRSKSPSDTTIIRTRNNSISSLLSMNSIDSQSVISNFPVITTTPSICQNSETSNNNTSVSASPIDDDNENKVDLEEQLPLANSIEIQCSIDNDREILNNENIELQTKIQLLEKEIDNLNFQISTFSTATDKVEEHENQIKEYQKLIECKNLQINELENKIHQQNNDLEKINEDYSVVSKEQTEKIDVLTRHLDEMVHLFENERLLRENQRLENKRIQEELEAKLHERTLDFEEMKRRLVKTVREKAELFNSLHSFEIKLEEEQSKKWIADEDATNCSKCNALFGWTLRRHHCRNCKQIFCYYCSNNWIPGPKPNSPQCRVCDHCSEKLLRQSLMLPNQQQVHDNQSTNCETNDDVDIHFEVRAERLPISTTDSQSKS